MVAGDTVSLLHFAFYESPPATHAFVFLHSNQDAKSLEGEPLSPRQSRFGLRVQKSHRTVRLGQCATNASHVQLEFYKSSLV